VIPNVNAHFDSPFCLPMPERPKANNKLVKLTQERFR
jgi:hypothetical protein